MAPGTIKRSVPQSSLQSVVTDAGHRSRTGAARVPCISCALDRRHKLRRLNPNRPSYDPDLKARWRCMRDDERQLILEENDREIARRKGYYRPLPSHSAARLAIVVRLFIQCFVAAMGPTAAECRRAALIAHPFETDANDHCETSPMAYRCERRQRAAQQRRFPVGSRIARREAPAQRAVSSPV
jgi:hypothetical protein